ncbi:plasmid pRiA4b ORF-3 family protein [Rhodococcus sp. NPDC003348]
MGASASGRRLRSVPTDPDALRSFVEETRAWTEPLGAVAYRLRIDLDGVFPAVWRRLVVPSTLRLDELHPVLQSAMGWKDTHLHQWLRPDPQGFGDGDRYAMRSSIEDGFDEGARCEEKVRLDDVLRAPGDVLEYEYDFGDGWEHTVVLEAIDRDASPDESHCIAGERACPPEDCGGASGYRHLVAVLADRAHSEREDLLGWLGGEFDPEAFDVDAVNVNLAARDAVRLHPPVLDSRFAALLARIPHQAAPRVHALVARADLQDRLVVPFEEMESAALAQLRWLLRRIGTEGIALTAAGYVPSEHVAAARDELDWGGRWTGPREADNPLFRRLLDAGRAFGLTRKYKGALLLTKRGATLLRRDSDLWEHVVTTVPLGREQIEYEAGRLLLLGVAAGATRGEQRAALAEGLEALGWCLEDGGVLDESDAWRVAAATADFLELIGAVTAYSPRDAGRPPDWARGFARMALSM